MGISFGWPPVNFVLLVSDFDGIDTIWPSNSNYRDFFATSAMS